MELDFRKETILKLIVDNYVKAVKPVSSKIVSETLDCSPATVRNEMVLLEEYGYLEKSHLSSGRIPTQKGYRYYVDYLMQPKKMSDGELEKLELIVNNSSLVVSDVIKQSLQIISELTNCTLVTLNNNTNNYLKQVEIVPLSENSFLAIIVTDSGHIEHKNMTIQTGVSLDEVKKTIDIVNKLLVGSELNTINEKLELEIKPIIASNIKHHEIIYDTLYKFFREAFTNINVNYVGKNNMLNQPEFTDIEKIRSIMDKLDDDIVIDRIAQNNEEISIFIGDEGHIDEDVSVVQVNCGPSGKIALIGPKRMEYDKVISLLEYLKKEIERK